MATEQGSRPLVDFEHPHSQPLGLVDEVIEVGQELLERHVTSTVAPEILAKCGRLRRTDETGVLVEVHEDAMPRVITQGIPQLLPTLRKLLSTILDVVQ